MLGMVVDVEVHLNFTVPPSSTIDGNTSISVSGFPESNFLFTNHLGSVTTDGGRNWALGRLFGNNRVSLYSNTSFVPSSLSFTISNFFSFENIHSRAFMLMLFYFIMLYCLV